MKKSHIATLLIFLLVIPATLYFGLRLTGRAYYLTSTLVIIEIIIPFLLAFESRRPQARELVVIAVLSALAVAARVAIPIPNFKAIFAIIMLSGIAFGPEAGFLVGAVSAFASNFFYGQGAYTPWQMFAYGAGGMLAGFLFAKGRLPQKRWVMAAFGLCPVCRPTAGHLHGISDPAHYQRSNGMAALYLRLPGEYQPRRLHGSDHGVVRPRAAGEAGAGKAAIRHDGGRRWGLKPAIRR